jgi:hypothetical protein
MQADQLTFGVEIESYIPRTCPINIGSYHSGRRIHAADYGDEYAPLDRWNTQRDASIQPRSGMTACEFVSPVLSGRDGLKNLWDAVECIKRVCGARVNASCGVHVHVGFPRDPDALKRLVHLVACHEKALYAVSGTPRREHGRWCGGIQQDYSPDITFSMGYGSNLRCSEPSAEGDRYKLLNLTNMMGGRRNTVEFRLFSESNNRKKVVAWVRLCLALVERALDGKKPVKWFSNDKAVVEKGGKSGPGFKELKFLCYKIGWVRGRCYQIPGDLNSHRTYGGSMMDVDGLPTLIQSKAELKKLAKKYDEKVAEMQRSGRW